MALPAGMPTVADVKSYYRIENTVEDTLLDELLSEAYGVIQTGCGKSLTHASVTWYDDATTLRLPGAVTSLLLRDEFVDPATIVVKDCLGTVVDPHTYTIRLDKGMICAIPPNQGSFVGGPLVLFDNGPYTITCDAGFDCATDYAYTWLPSIRRTILDLVGFYYQQRTPGAQLEMVAGTRLVYELDPGTGLPKRVAEAIQKLRGIVYGR